MAIGHEQTKKKNTTHELLKTAPDLKIHCPHFCEHLSLVSELFGVINGAKRINLSTAGDQSAQEHRPSFADKLVARIKTDPVLSPAFKAFAIAKG